MHILSFHNLKYIYDLLFALRISYNMIKERKDNNHFKKLVINEASLCIQSVEVLLC